MSASEEPWPDQARLVVMIEERFDFLVRDHWFVRGAAAAPPVVYDLEFMSMLHRVRIGPDLDARSLDVECSWPDQQMPLVDEAPTISLAEIVAMRSPGVEVPRDLSTESAARTTLARSAELLRTHAIDVLSGGSGLWFDFVDWKRTNGDLGEGRWWGHPIYDEIAEVSMPRTVADIERDLEFEPIHALAHRDPERAWANIVDFVRRHPGTSEATMLLEDVVYQQGDSFIERIEELARHDRQVRETVRSMYVGGIASAAAGRFLDLQEELRDEP